jgi:hypothetical protein
MKSASFEPYLDLAARCPVPLEIALGGEGAPADLLRANGWLVQNPLEVALDPWDYQQYIEHSRGEFSVAKHGYVVSNSGWFSERSAAYLASGRPVVTQQTGFSEWLDADSGVLPFRDPDEALDALSRIEADYDTHSAAARAVAEKYFDAREVLPALLSMAIAGTKA